MNWGLAFFRGDSLSCTGDSINVGTDWGVYKDIYCAGNDTVFTFMDRGTRAQHRLHCQQVAQGITHRLVDQLRQPLQHPQRRRRLTGSSRRRRINRGLCFRNLDADNELLQLSSSLCLV